MRIPLLLIAVLLLAAESHAQTTRPPSFTVTAGATTKQVLFDWDPVPTAVIYKLLWKTETDQYFEPYDGVRYRRTRIALPLAVHLEKWPTTRYVVLACNPAGCTRSNEIEASSFMLDAIGYLKASNTDAQDRFGGGIAISADGTTLAVAADGEDGGVGGQGNTSPDSGAVYVFRRNARVWTQEAYLKAPGAPAGHRIGGAGSAPVRGKLLSLSSNGSVLAVGAPMASSVANAQEGRVLVFRRGTDNTWTADGPVMAPTPRGADYFGYHIDLSSDGMTLMAISGGDPGVAGFPAGLTHLYTWTGTAWHRTASLPPYYPGDICPLTRMSANARVLVSTCTNGPGSRMRAVTRRLVAGAWVRYADLPINWRGPQPMAINYDGTKLAINYSSWTYSTFGIGVYRWENNVWTLNGTLIEPTGWYPPAASGTWGSALEFDRFGAFLAVGDPKCFAYGAGATPPVIGTEPHGCVHLYEEFIPLGSTLPSWRQRSRLKAPNPATGDLFGSSVALSGSGWYLAIGAPAEDSAARGVDGDQTSNAATDSGAVYLY